MKFSQLCHYSNILIKQENNIMQELLAYHYRSFISEQSELSDALLKLAPINLLQTQVLYSSKGTHHKLMTQSNHQLMQYLLAKSYISYSPSNLEIKLNISNVMFYQRSHKLQQFVSNRLHPIFSEALKMFIDNQLLPFSFQSKKIRLLFETEDKPIEGIKANESKNKKKKEDKQKMKEEVKDVSNALDYSRFIYEYSNSSQKSKESEVQYLININELTQLLRMHVVEKHIHSDKDRLINICKLSLKEGEDNVKSLSFFQLYQIIKQNRSKLPFITQIIEKIKVEKIEDYLVQIFRRLDFQKKKQEDAQENMKQDKRNLGEFNHSRNILLVFNLIKKYPYITEKQLVTHSLLHILELRKSLNLLISEGLISYYQENIRTTLYKIIDWRELEKRYVNHIAKSILNIYMAMNNPIIKSQQLVRLECVINQLDDVLLLFGY